MPDPEQVGSRRATPPCTRRTLAPLRALLHLHLGFGSRLHHQLTFTVGKKAPSLRRCVSSLTSPKGRKEIQ